MADMYSKDKLMNKVTLYDRLQFDNANVLSEHLTDILYDSLNSSVSTNQRLQILLLLQQWCRNGGAHFAIDDDNIDCFLGCINWEKYDTILQEDFGPLPNENVDPLLTYFNKLKVVTNKRNSIKNFIRREDSRRHTAVNDMYPFKKKENIKFSELLIELDSLYKEGGCCDRLKNLKKFKDQNATPQKTVRLQESRITILYSLLNLAKFRNNFDLINPIINYLLTNDERPLTTDEEQFMSYIWKNHDIFNIPEQTVNKLVEKCSFIYEEVFIKACTNLIQNKENDLEEDIKRIDLISKSNDRLRLKIISLFYELYACSNYNVKLKSLICTT